MIKNKAPLRQVCQIPTCGCDDYHPDFDDDGPEQDEASQPQEGTR